MTDPIQTDQRLPLPPAPIRLLLGGLLTAAIVLIAIAAAGLGDRVCGCSPTPVPTIQSPVEGIVIFVDVTSLADVRDFRLRLAGGPTIDFKMGTLENAAEFSPSHLSEHQATGSPVRVYFRVEGLELVVYRLEDAAPGATPSPAAS